MVGRDGGFPVSNNGTATLFVYIEDANDNRPVFSPGRNITTFIIITILAQLLDLFILLCMDLQLHTGSLLTRVFLLGNPLPQSLPRTLTSKALPILISSSPSQTFLVLTQWVQFNPPLFNYMITVPSSTADKGSDEPLCH